MPQATFSLDGHDAPILENLTDLAAGDTEIVTWYIDGFEADDAITSITMYAKVDPADADADPDTMTVVGTLTTPVLAANARDVEFALSSADTTALVLGRVYHIRVLLVRDATTYQQTVAFGFIAAAHPGATAVAPSDEAVLRAQGDATTYANAVAYTDQQITGAISVDDIVDLATADTGITSVGTITTGVWHGTPIEDQYLATISTAGKVANSATTATPFAVPFTIVARDASGNIEVNVISGDIQGNAETATHLATARTFELTGDIAGSTSSDLSGPVTIPTQITAGTIVNGDVNAAAAIAYSKLNLTNSIVNADISGTAAIGYGKLVLTGSIVNADISPTAAIAYAKLALLASIVNADISPTAGIAYGKLSLSNSIVNADINTAAAIVDTKLATIATAGKVSNSATTATNANTASTIVARDSLGNFNAGTITATLSGNMTGNVTGNVNGSVTGTVTGSLVGNASTATALQTARTINGVSFDGTANITVAAAAATLTGTTLASNVVASSLTTVGVLAGPHMTTPVVDSGGLTVTAGGLTVSAGTLSAQALTATTGTFSGALTATTGLTVSSGTTAVQALTATTGLFTGAVTVGAQLNANGGIVVSAGTFASNAIVVHPSYGLVLGASSGTIYSFGIFTSAALPILAVPTGTRDIAFSGAATVTGLMTANAGIAVAGGAFVPGNIYKSATSGTSIACQTGSAYDFAVPNVAGTLNVMAVPTGTNNITFFGLISAAGLPTSAGASGTLYVDGSGFVKRA